MERNRFLFYLDWKNQMDMMTDEQVRRFVYNLCNYTEGKKVDLPTDIEKALWIGVVPSMRINQEKYEKKVQSNQENGKLGGAPIGNQNARKDKTTQNNPNNLISDNCKLVNDKGEMIIDKREKINEKGELEKENWELENDNSNTSSGILEEKKLIPGTNMAVDDIDIEFLEMMLTPIFNKYANWEEEIFSLPIDDFIQKTIENNPVAQYRTTYIRAFKYSISKKKFDN
jgi:hypothetical protein